LYCCGLTAQTAPASRSFEIVSTGSVQNISDYINALEHTFLDRYRAVDYRTLMHFQEGVVVELLSAKELRAMGIPVNMDVLNTVSIKGLKFTLLSSGRIVKWTPTQTTRP